MIGFNRFKSKVKTNVSVIPGFLKKSEKEMKSSTLSRKASLQSKRIIIIGNKRDFLSNLLSTVLQQYESCIKLITFSQNQPNSPVNGSSGIREKEESSMVESVNIDLDSKDDDVVVDKLRNSIYSCTSSANHNSFINNEILLVLCFEWCEFSELYHRMHLVSRSCQGQDKVGGDQVVKILIAFPIGVEDSQFQQQQQHSIESIFNPISTVFLFYSALMQWLFVGPPTSMNNHTQYYIQLSITKQEDEGCFWLDCDDLIKVIVDLLVKSQEIRDNKMYVLTGKELLTSKEISDILYNEFKIIVEDLHESDIPKLDVLKRKFYNYLSSPVSTLSSPDIEVLLNNLPNTFSNFLKKCNETQSFISLFKSKTIASPSPTTSPNASTTVTSSSSTTSTTTTNTSGSSSITTAAYSIGSSISTVSTSAYKFVSNSLNFLKYSKDFIEETIYKSPSPTTPTSPTATKKTNQPEITQYILLLTETFKKVYIDSTIGINDTPPPPPPRPHYNNNSSNNTSPVLNSNNNSNNNSLNSSNAGGNIVNLEFSSEDYTVETRYDISLINKQIQAEPQQWELYVLAGNIFKSIRDFYEIKDFLLSEKTQNEIIEFVEVETVGRSGSFFFRSIDDRYFIKTIPANEYDTFVKLFQSYYQHIVKYPSTLLPRFYGFYKLKGKLKAYNIYGNETLQQREIIFCVMSNLFYSSDPKLFIHEKYDLKGSTVGRFVNVPTPGTTNTTSLDQESIPTLKDLNLKRKFYLGTNKKIFSAQIAVDTEWMLSHGICDYSLLVGVHINSNTNTPTTTPTKKCDISFFKQHHYGISPNRVKPITVIPIKKRSQSMSATLPNTTTSPPLPPNRPASKTPPPMTTQNLQASLPSSLELSSPTTSVSSISSTSSSSSSLSSLDIDTENGGNLIYFFGLIDILTTYNLKKRGETALKSMIFDRAKISSINPTDYQSRFVKFIESTLE
ncbi:hypothetical protein DLAC_06687 [Tieghemostelium lacteum]|uniref:PIPK domain-containing protein n=1 Tax=Tieghemostelium lacteum TaxID=361077 RepID=A0A151ZFK1_TIELA|nr:hypothetical protein DLAC_06687 [Tieghemostelium lacteum]|eukprot:KYQ92689.1 hypothetical protein DLAC_06687 [Tieghemostelium lacteum]